MPHYSAYALLRNLREDATFQPRLRALLDTLGERDMMNLRQDDGGNIWVKIKGKKPDTYHILRPHAAALAKELGELQTMSFGGSGGGLKMETLPGFVSGSTSTYTLVQPKTPPKAASPICGRCQGTGNVWFSTIKAGVCFRCGGSGKNPAYKAPK
jgi:hypothetical protein